MKRVFSLAGLLTLMACEVALAQGAPKIQFDRTVYDFGKTSQVESVSGVFKFKNVGTGPLKIEKPQPTCGCTVAALKTDTLQPGESSELSFTLNLGRAKATLEKHITVVSNDPESPRTQLTVKADYTPLYDISPATLMPNIAYGSGATNLTLTVSRTDGKPVGIAKFNTSKPWITAKFEPGAAGSEAVGKVNLKVEPDGEPRRFTEWVQLFADEKDTQPLSIVYIYGRLMGAVTLSPEAYYWSVTDPAKVKTEKVEAVITRRITVRSSNGKEFSLKNPQITLAGMTNGVSLEVVKKEEGRAYDLVAKLNDVPEKTTTGEITVETTLAEQPKIRVPVTINIFNAKR